MHIRKKSTLSPTEIYKNINSEYIEYNISERVMRKFLKEEYGENVAEIDRDEIDFSLIIKKVFSNYFKTDSFIIESYQIPEGYVSALFEDFGFPSLPIPVKLYFDFKSDKEVNLYKLKNPEKYESLFSERVKLLSKLLK